MPAPILVIVVGTIRLIGSNADARTGASCPSISARTGAVLQWELMLDKSGRKLPHVLESGGLLFRMGA